MDKPVMNSRSLKEVSQLLQLLYHRNKNQHRLAKWWKWLCMLRRCVPKLLVELHSYSKTEIFARATYLQQILLPRCYRNFSQVVSDGQFAALGLVLIAAVAKIDALFTMPRNSVKQLNSDEARSTEIDVETEMGPLEDQGRSVPRSMQSLHVELEPGKEQQPPTTAISWLEGTDAQARSYGRIHRSANGLGVGYLSSNKLKTSKRKKGNGCNIIDELFSSVDRGSRQYK